MAEASGKYQRPVPASSKSGSERTAPLGGAPSVVRQVRDGAATGMTRENAAGGSRRSRGVGRGPKSRGRNSSRAR